MLEDYPVVRAGLEHKHLGGLKIKPTGHGHGGTFTASEHPRKPSGKFAPKPKSGQLHDLAAKLKKGDAGQSAARDKPVLSPEAYRALKPNPRYSPGLRRRTLDGLGDGPDQRILADTLARFQDGGGINRLRVNIARRLAGESVPKQTAHRIDTVLNAIRHSPKEFAPTVLHRGMAVKGGPGEILARYQSGSKLDLNLTSFSSSRTIAREFADANDARGRTRVLIEWHGDKNALPIQNTSDNPKFHREAEWVAAGKFRVVQSRRSGDRVVLRIEQVATL